MIARTAHDGLPSLADAMSRVEKTIGSIPGIEPASQQLADGLHGAALSSGAARALADALHGSWLGHPLHPVLTDIPIGAWSLAAMFDLYAALTGQRHAEQTADALIAIGAAAAVPTALAGIADYSAIKQDAAPVALAHGILNSAGLALYLLALRDRTGGNRARGRLLSALAYAAVGLSASLGGHMVYQQRVGVNHTPDTELPEHWVAALPLVDIAEFEARRVEVDGVPVMVYRDPDGIHAINAVCGHAGGPLEAGSIEGHCVECPWHQSVFDMRDGHVVHGPATQPQPAYDARVRDGMIELRRRAAGAPMSEAEPAPLEREVGGS